MAGRFWTGVRVFGLALGVLSSFASTLDFQENFNDHVVSAHVLGRNLPSGKLT